MLCLQAPLRCLLEDDHGYCVRSSCFSRVAKYMLNDASSGGSVAPSVDGRRVTRGFETLDVLRLGGTLAGKRYHVARVSFQGQTTQAQKLLNAAASRDALGVPWTVIAHCGEAMTYLQTIKRRFLLLVKMCVGVGERSSTNLSCRGWRASTATVMRTPSNTGSANQQEVGTHRTRVARPSCLP